MLNILVALLCEARPLINYYRLEMAYKTPFRVYSNQEITLIVSGVGKIAAATASTYLHVYFIERPAKAWLNIGIAGHQNQPMGQILQADKITDYSSGQSWSVQLANSTFATGQVLTVDLPEKNYLLPWLYEMEAAGFYSAIRRLTPDIPVHCLKIISDNSDNPIAKITSKMVSQLIRENLSHIDEVIGKLLKF